MVGSVYSSSAYMTPPAILYFHTSQIRPKIENCSYSWVGVAQSSLSSLDIAQRLVGDELFSGLKPLAALSLLPQKVL